MIILINPNLVAQRSDTFTTGIVYMPYGLAYVAASLRAAGFPVRVIDAFAEQPRQRRHVNQFLVLGLTFDEVVERLPAEVTLVIVYAINVSNHLSTAGIAQAIKQARPELPVAVLENTQAVSAYSLRQISQEFYTVGVDFILTGEGEHRVVALAKVLEDSASPEALRAIDGLGCPAFYTPPRDEIADLDALPFPAWDLFPVEHYWQLRFAHAPLTSGRYLPLLTSRGCPFKCKFCVNPAMNRRWRARSARNVVDEMAHWGQALGVTEFHIEDLNPTVNDRRTREICEEILRRGLRVTWKLGSGTKVETIKDEETVDLMAKAGCRYISISPETGSPDVLAKMGKPFDLAHAERIVARMNRVGIRSQACFVLGFPGETAEDRQRTWEMVHRLTKHGVDEIAQFIVAPLPGSQTFDDLRGFESLSELTFSPAWRSDYAELSHFRLRLYKHFLGWKIRYHPGAVLRQTFNFICRRFETKMEMAPYRALVLKWLDLTCPREKGRRA